MPPEIPVPALEGRKPAFSAWVGWAVVLGLVAYFLVKYAFHYFVFTPESYGTYFWPRFSWLLPHVAAGVLAIVIGPLQFWPRMRRDYLQAHRVAGRIYVGLVLVGAAAAVGLASKIEGSPAYSLGLVGLAVAWLTTTSLAFVAIRRKNLLQHQQWMVRSYVVTFAFVTFRLADDVLKAANIQNEDERSKYLAWACWAVPLLITEVAIQGRAVFQRRD
jgi:hypothetical protein